MPREWYHDGLRFECTMCGGCCSGGPGLVRFTEAEARVMAAALGVTPEGFASRFTRLVDGRPALREQPSAHGLDCVFLDRQSMPGKALCSLYEARPAQCRSFPWWPEHLESPGAWRRLGQSCEGVGRGRVVPVSEIRISVRPRGPASD